MVQYDNGTVEDERFANSPEVAQAVLSLLQERVAGDGPQPEGVEIYVSALWDRKGYAQIGAINDKSPYRHDYDSQYRVAIEIILPKWDDDVKKVLSVAKDELAARDEQRDEARRQALQAEIDQHNAQAARLAAELAALKSN